MKTFMAETEDIASVVMFSHKDPQVPGLVAGMALSLWFDIRDPEEKEAFLAAGAMGENGCLRVVGIAAEVAARKILELRV